MASLNKDTIKDVFVQHGEKAGFLFVALVLAFLVFSGMQQEGLESNQTPDALVQLAENKQRTIDDSNFDAFSTVRRANPQLVEEVQNQSEMVASNFIQGPTVEPVSKAKTFRPDPELRTAMRPEVTGGFHAIALSNASRNPEKVFNLPFAEAEEVRGGGESGGGDDSFFPGGYDPSGDEGGFPEGSGAGRPSGSGSGAGRPSSGGPSSGGPSSGPSSGGPSSGPMGDDGFPGGFGAATSGPGKQLPAVQRAEMLGVAGKVASNASLYKTYVVGVS
ncbi:MAG: hypothetical protein VX936_05955, partial [Planctomycetota bacterium]|nr:hypothetical protein [Planctomycetota bacterium]